MEVHKRFAMLIYNNFEITTESSDILTYKNIIQVYKDTGLCEYYDSFFYSITDKNIKIIIDNLLKDYYKKSHSYEGYQWKKVFVGLKIKECISKNYGMGGEEYLKQIIDEHVVKSNLKTDCVKIEDLYNILCSNIFFKSDNIYLTSDLTINTLSKTIRMYDDFYDNHRFSSNVNGKKVSHIIRKYKMR